MQIAKAGCRKNKPHLASCANIKKLLVCQAEPCIQYKNLHIILC